MVRQALLLRRIGERAERNSRKIEGFLRTQPEATDPTTVLRNAVITCEQAADLGSRGPAALWLGESWCEEPDAKTAGRGVQGPSQQLPDYTPTVIKQTQTLAIQIL